MTEHASDGKARGRGAAVIVGVAFLLLVLAVLYMVARPDDDLRGRLDDGVVAGASTEPRAPQRVPGPASGGASVSAEPTAPEESERAAPPTTEVAPSPAPFVPESATLSIRTSSGGKRAPNVRVELSDGQTSRSDPRGQAVFRVLTTPPGDDLTVRAFRADGVAREVRIPVRGNHSIVLALDRRDRPLELTIQLAGEAAEVVTRARIALDLAREEGASRIDRHETVTFRAGFATVTTDYEMVRVRVVADGFMPWRSELLRVPLDVDRATVTADLARGGRVFGRIRRAEGAPTRQVALVLVQTAKGPPPSLREGLRSYATQRELSDLLEARRDLEPTATFNSFTFEGVAPGRYELEVRDVERTLVLPAREVTMRGDEAVGPIELELPAGRDVRIFARYGTTPIPVKVRLLPHAGDDPASPPASVEEEGLTASGSSTGAIVHGVPPGVYTVRLETPPVPDWAHHLGEDFARALAAVLLAVERTAAGGEDWIIEVEADEAPTLLVEVHDVVSAWMAVRDEPRSEPSDVDRALDRCFASLLESLPVELQAEVRVSADPPLVFLHALIAIAKDRDFARLLNWIMIHP